MSSVPVSPRPIKPLSALVASQIAAGEVVERPASVVKELVENALDAGAARIRVELEQGGIELVSVSDDGCGMTPGDLPLALAPHATSKVESAADLDRIGTLGFRGEALASIASVSRMSIRTRCASESGAWQIDAEGERLAPARPVPGPVGTLVVVRNLFFNTPARRKFLRTVPTEQTRALDTLRDLALAHPAVGFTAACDGRVVLELSPEHGPRARALAILGAELADQLLDVHADEFDDARGLALWGLAGLPSLARATTKCQHVFVNGRAIRDRTIQHAIAEAYRGLIEPGRFPTVVLMLVMSPEGVDVNVHPAKAEVRFRDGSMVHSAVLGALRRALQAADLTAPLPQRPWNGSPGGRPDPEQILAPSGAGGKGGTSFASPPERAASFVEYFTRTIPERTGGRFQYDEIRRAVQPGPMAAPGGSRSGEEPSAGTGPAAIAAAAEGAGAAGTTGAAGDGSLEPGITALPTLSPAARVLQVHNSFLVTQDVQGMLIVDQHALHERVMFQRLLERITRGPLESQRLLTPVVVDVSGARVAALDELTPLLNRIGLELAPIGPGQIAAHAFPTFLFERGVDPTDFIRDLLDRSDEDGFVPTSEDALRDVLDMMACKAAVKAGDQLSDLELGELLAQREEVERASNCPHGRPTSIRVSIRDLERIFGRS